jgi:hypothetical protein
VEPIALPIVPCNGDLNATLCSDGGLAYQAVHKQVTDQEYIDP